MTEMISVDLNSSVILGILTPQAIAEYYRKHDQLSDLLEQFDDDELIDHIGLDNILENNETAVREHFDNMNASQEDMGSYE